MKHFLSKINKVFMVGLLAFSLSGGALYNIHLANQKADAAFYAVQSPATTLYSGIASGATSARLRSFKDIYGYTLTMPMFGSVGYVTFEPGVAGKEEVASFTGITDNGDGTQTITGLSRGLWSRLPFGTGGIGRSHGSNTYVVVSNSGEFYNQVAFKNNNEAITGTWNFNSFLPTSNIIATSSSQFVTKGYADALSFAGVATSSETNFGGVWLGTALQQASSTNGGVNKPYAMQTKYATDTPQSGCAVGYTSVAGAGCSVIAQLTGKIRQTWLDIFTTANTWTAQNTFSATSTMATTTTALLTGNVPSKCQIDNFASTTWNSQGTTKTFFVNFPHTLGYSPNVWRSDFNSYDPDGTVSYSWGSGMASTTGAAGGGYGAFYVTGVFLTPLNFASSSVAFISPKWSSTGQGAGGDFVRGYVNYTSSTSTQLRLDALDDGAGGGSPKLYFTLEQCI